MFPEYAEPRTVVACQARTQTGRHAADSHIGSENTAVSANRTRIRGDAYPHVKIGRHRLRHIVCPELAGQRTTHEQRRMRRSYAATQRSETQVTTMIDATAAARGTAHILYVAVYIVKS